MPDLPGHGESRGVPWVSLGETTERVAGLIRERATEGRAHVVGLSLGAYVIAHLLATEPERVDHAVVSGLNVLPFPHPGRMRAMGYLMAPFLKTKVLLRANARGLEVPEVSYERYRRGAVAMSRRAFLRIGNELLAFRLRAGLAGVPCPTLVVAGEQEHELIRRSVPALVAALPRAEGRLAPGLGRGWSGGGPSCSPRRCGRSSPTRRCRRASCPRRGRSGRAAGRSRAARTPRFRGESVEPAGDRRAAWSLAAGRDRPGLRPRVDLLRATPLPAAKLALGGGLGAAALAAARGNRHRG